MSANFYELLKYAATGIASPDMTYYDKMRASTLMGGVVRTLTGITPLSFKANGTPLISWSMKGNGQQTGTPTPDAPIMPEFVGVRTGNLFDAATAYGNLYNNGVVSGTTYDIYSINNFFDESLVGKQITISIRADKVTATRIYVRVNIAGSTIDSNSIYAGSTGVMSVTVTPQSINDRWNVTYGSNAYNECILSNFMLNLGSTALPYEPYGWAEKITCAGQTTPVYLGQVSTVRRIKKLVLDGDENWGKSSDGNFFITLSPYKGVAWVRVLSTHFAPSQIQTNGRLLWFVNASVDFDTVEECKTYLASEYAAGHPVTVWYVLAEPETAIVNEPLCKIGDYADELHSTDAGVTIPTAKGANVLTVDTDLQPSEMTIMYRK